LKGPWRKRSVRGTRSRGWLLPPSVRDLVPEGHLAHFERDAVREDLDLSEVLSAYVEERGYPPYHPALMVAVLLYGCCVGLYSSRRIARGLEERVDFMAVSGRERPDFRAISEFRRRHLRALGRLFPQALALCRQAGLLRLGHVSLDGTKIRANASKHKAMSSRSAACAAGGSRARPPRTPRSSRRPTARPPPGRARRGRAR
jgi:transposase